MYNGFYDILNGEVSVMVSCIVSSLTVTLRFSAIFAMQLLGYCFQRVT